MGYGSASETDCLIGNKFYESVAPELSSPRANPRTIPSRTATVDGSSRHDWNCLPIQRSGESYEVLFTRRQGYRVALGASAFPLLQRHAGFRADFARPAAQPDLRLRSKPTSRLYLHSEFRLRGPAPR